MFFYFFGRSFCGKGGIGDLQEFQLGFEPEFCSQIQPTRSKFGILYFSEFREKEIQIKTQEKCWSFFLSFDLQGSSVKVWSSHEMRYVVAIYDVKMICTPKSRRYLGRHRVQEGNHPPPWSFYILPIYLYLCIWNVRVFLITFIWNMKKIYLL